MLRSLKRKSEYTLPLVNDLLLVYIAYSPTVHTFPLQLLVASYIHIRLPKEVLMMSVIQHFYAVVIVNELLK